MRGESEGLLASVFSLPGKLVVGSREVGIDVTEVTAAGIAASIAGSSLDRKLRHELATGAWVHAELTLGDHPLVLSGRIYWSNASYAADARVLVDFEGLDGASGRLIETWMLDRAERFRVKDLPGDRRA